jgi:hypothetical protein
MGLVLSPARAGPIEIDSDSDEDQKVEHRPMIGLKSSTQRKATPAKNDHPSSDDYGDMDMDDGFLEELQKTEAQYIAPAGPTQASRRQVVEPDVDLTIDDDDDMEDKENVRAPQRHVRRRVFGETKAMGEVIEISDSD